MNKDDDWGESQPLMRAENGGSCAWLDGAGPLDSFGGKGIGNPTLRCGTVVR